MLVAADDPKPLVEQLSLLQKTAAAAAIGLVLALSCAGYGVWWLAWCGLAPFLVLLRSCKNWREAAVAGLAFGFAYNLLSLIWLYSLHIEGVPAQLSSFITAIVALVDTIVRALPCMLLSLLLYVLPMRAGIFPGYRRPFFPYILTVPVIWIFFEYLSGLSTGIHLNDLCYSQSGQLILIQIARLGGCKLLTLLLVLSNTALAQLLMTSGNLVRPLGKRSDQLLGSTGSVIDFLTVVLLVALCTLIGRGSGLSSDVPAISVSTAGRNCESINLGDCTVTAGNTVLVHGQPVNVARILGTPNQLLYLSTRRSSAARLFLLPARGLRLARFIDSADLAGNILAKHLINLPNESAAVINIAAGRFGISTGLALTSTALIKEQVKQGAGLLVFMTGPGNFHSTILNREILAAAVLRAMENGRYVIFCSGNEICAVIDPFGKIIAQSLAENTLTGQVQFLYRNTYFHNVEFN